MRSRLPPDLLQRSAQESSRLLALGYLGQIDDAQRRLGDSLDREALHDFRVGLRRLRSSLRAYQGPLKGSVTAKMRKQIRRLARATNGGRDTEVQLAWLRKLADGVSAQAAPGFYWLVGRFECRQQERHDRKIADIARRYTKAAGNLRKALGTLRIELVHGRIQRAATFGEVTGALARQQVSRLRNDLSRIGDASDAEGAHRARIAAKRLRYLLEPIARRNRRARTLVGRLKEVQDLLGEHHDLRLLSMDVASLRTARSGDGVPGLEPGFESVAGLAEEGAAAAFQRFRARWSSQLAARFLTRADELGRSLEQPPVPAAAGLPAPSPTLSLGEPVRLNVGPRIVTETR
jgi:CHAD domain-containing protein